MVPGLSTLSPTPVRHCRLALLGLFALLATPASSAVTSYSGGITQTLGPKMALRDVHASVAFEIRTAWLGPVTLQCVVAWPEGSLRRRFRGTGSLQVECSDGIPFEAPASSFHSGRGAAKHTARFRAAVDLGRCQPPIRVEANVRLRGAALERFVRRNVLPPTGLPLEVVCEAAAPAGLVP